jgi:putative hemolysin
VSKLHNSCRCLGDTEVHGDRYMTAVAFETIIIFLLILANGLLAMSEMAVVTARKPRLQQMAEDGNAGAATAFEMTKAPGPFLSAVQIGITLVGILIGVFGGVALSGVIAQRLASIAFLRPYASAVAVGLVVVLLTYLTLVLGELVPKQIALRKSEQIASLVSRPMSLLARITAPFVIILSVSSDTVLRIMQQRPSDEPAVTDEDVRIMLAQGADLGIFEPMEEEIVGQLFRLGDQRIGDLITPRTEIVWIEESDSPDIVREKVVWAGRSRFPVARDNLDHVSGIVLAKDLLAQCLSGEPMDIRAIVQPALFVPESTLALSVIDRFKETHSKMAMVIDEYGGMEGLVTIDDVMGALVGEIREPEEPEEPGATQRADGSWLVDGLLLLDAFQDVVDIPELSLEATSHNRTVGGLVMTQLGRIPVTGERFQWQGFWFEVVDMDGRRVDKILVQKAEPDSDERSEV